jgi:plasmid stabilization system protein ParE
MSVVYRFEPDARAKYYEAIRYYATGAEDAEVAARVVTTIESALVAICAAPEMWRVVESQGLRRYVLRRLSFRALLPISAP